MNDSGTQKHRGHLRLRILVFGFLVLLAVVAFTFALTYTIIRDRSEQLEATYVGDAVERALFAVDEELYSLQATAADMAAWDDTYIYMETFDEGYDEANLGIDSFIRAGVALCPSVPPRER